MSKAILGYNVLLTSVLHGKDQGKQVK